MFTLSTSWPFRRFWPNSSDTDISSRLTSEPAPITVTAFRAAILGFAGFVLSMGTATANPDFSPAQTNPFGLSDVGKNSSLAIVDLDDDGDFDVIVMERTTGFYYFENTGSSTEPVFAEALNNPFGLVPPNGGFRPVVADLDGDGDFDVLAGDTFEFFENVGSANSPAFANPVAFPFGINDRIVNNRIASVDIDADGDLDLFAVNREARSNYFYENTGTPTAPAFAEPLVDDFFGLTTVNAYPGFADLDGDGDVDLFAGEGMASPIVYYENTGTPTSPVFIDAPVFDPFGLSNPNTDAAMDFADLDGDGSIDVLYGSRGGNIYFQSNADTPPVECPCWTEVDLLVINKCPDNLTCPVELFDIFEP